MLAIILKLNHRGAQLQLDNSMQRQLCEEVCCLTGHAACLFWTWHVTTTAASSTSTAQSLLQIVAREPANPISQKGRMKWRSFARVTHIQKRMHLRSRSDVVLLTNKSYKCVHDDKIRYFRWLTDSRIIVHLLRYLKRLSAHGDDCKSTWVAWVATWHCKRAPCNMTLKK